MPFQNEKLTVPYFFNVYTSLGYKSLRKKYEKQLGQISLSYTSVNYLLRDLKRKRMADKLMTHKIDPSVDLDNQFSEPTNQNSIKVPKFLCQRKRKHYSNTFGISVINRSNFLTSTYRV